MLENDRLWFFSYSAHIGKLTYLGMWRSYFFEMEGRQREEASDLKVFADSRDKSATNLRDKVYALRGIASKAIAEGIIIDYQRSVEKIYSDLASHLLKVQPDCVSFRQ